MGSEYWKQPAKRLDREFRAMGAGKKDRSAHATSYRFPDGAYMYVPHNIGPGNARAMLHDMQARYGRAQRASGHDPLVGTVIRKDIPKVDLERVVMSHHATERFDQMNGQVGLAPAEVLHAIQFPEKVRWSPAHESWMWVRGRIAVATVVSDESDHMIIRTVLWATEELWDANPRPEKA